MVFNSYLFVLLFLPLCISGYFLLNHFRQYTLAQVYLLGMSLWFYGYANPAYLLLICGSVLTNFFLGRCIHKAASAPLRKMLLAFSIAVNLGLLFYFKYYNFFLQNLNQVFQTSFDLKNIALPLGISFFTFQQVSFVVDAYRGEVGKYSFWQYACFVTYFPQLVAGPIVTHDELIPQFMDPEKKRFQWGNFAPGLFLFALGMAKKVLIADTFGTAANWTFSNVALLDTTNAFFGSLAYTIQIYFDFSGYCDMAIGMGKMMNLNLPVNFDSPYTALTITDFWARWHKTLTRFFTRYLYIPLGGSRRGTARTYRNVMIVFLASGIWHGANYTFLLWGLLHGIFNVITRWKKSWFEKLHPVASWMMTFSFVNVTWILFRADSIGDALAIIRALVRMEFGPLNDHITSAFLLPEILFLIQHKTPLHIFYGNHQPLVLIAYLGALLLVLRRKNAYAEMQAFRPTPVRLVCTYILLVWCVLSFSSLTTFLYFNF